MFDRGAVALRLALARLPHVVMPPLPEEGVYLCPLCLEGFTRQQLPLLSQEHAPPRSVGGSVVALTCLDCNHEAAAMQSHASNRATWRRFVAREHGVSRTVLVQDHQGVTVTAEVGHLHGKFYIFVDPKRSNPDHLEALVNRLRCDSDSASESNFSLEGDVGFRVASARASDLRDAYLLSFALLGYQFALWPDLDEVRRRIAGGDPDPRLFMHTDGFPADFQGVITLSQPVECVCVISSGGDCVFLPWPTKAADLMGWLAAGAPLHGNVNGRAHPWPKDMPMLLDNAVAK